jgi:hypothetical protein
LRPSISTKGSTDTPVCTSVCTSEGKTVNEILDADLAALIEAWPTLPQPIRVGIVAMIKATVSRGP